MKLKDSSRKSVERQRWNKQQGERSDDSDNSADLDALKFKRQWCICLPGGLSKWEVDDESVSVM